MSVTAARNATPQVGHGGSARVFPCLQRRQPEHAGRIAPHRPAQADNRYLCGEVQHAKVGRAVLSLHRRGPKTPFRVGSTQDAQRRCHNCDGPVRSPTWKDCLFRKSTSNCFPRLAMECFVRLPQLLLPQLLLRNFDLAAHVEVVSSRSSSFPAPFKHAGRERRAL